MIENFEHDYMLKYWNIKLMEWCNYFENGKYNLSTGDKDIFDITNKYHGLIKWLIEKIYIDGRRRAFKEKLEIMGSMNPIKL